MKISSLILIGFFALAFAAARAEEANSQEGARTIVEHEGKFFQMGQEQGVRAAFLEFLAEDAIVFRPGPVNGRESWGARTESRMALIWQPVFAAMARSGDLGYTTGPSEWKKNKADEQALGYGQYVSIWKKQKDGSWKVALDVGTENPRPVKPAEPPELSFPTEAIAPQIDRAAAGKRLREAERKYAEAAKSDSTAALLGAATDGIRVYREGVFPGLGKDAAGLMLSVRRGKLAMTPMGRDISEAGDLAYSYGSYTLTRIESAERGHYLQIWRVGDSGWQLALDYQKPLPPEEKKPAE
jgi:ketosteroid isomerase-like protein